MKEKNVFFDREQPKFCDLFSVKSDSVISRMNKYLDDIPEQIPLYGINIERAGLIRENVPVRVLDPFYNKKKIVLNAKIEIYTGVSCQKRGLHMSRIGDVVAVLSQRNFKCIDDFVKEMAVKISESQFGLGTTIKLTAPFSFYENIISKESVHKKSLENIGLIYSVAHNDDGFRFDSGIEFNNITACPCVQQTFKHSLLESGVVEDDFKRMLPLLTHSQRCKTRVLIGRYKKRLKVLDVLKLIDASTIRVQNTLPRDHELSMVYKAHKCPQFMEDVVRKIVFSVYKKMRNEDPGLSVSVETDSMESIHDFNIQAKVDYSFKDLDGLIK